MGVDGQEKKIVFYVSVDEDFVIHYPGTMTEIEIRGWLDKVVDGVKDSLKARASLIRKD